MRPLACQAIGCDGRRVVFQPKGDPAFRPDLAQDSSIIMSKSVLFGKFGAASSQNALPLFRHKETANGACHQS
ncbi:hypothetical protein B4113_3243 [Geobacillus sp. B4113_201601]|nr:hypothetical protein B4113_3243 [Geobacillus sp. B4113_201601]